MMKYHATIKNGFTIVEMMIGMLIAMLCIIILLMLFKQISGVGGSAARNAEYDAQLETGMMVIQKQIQNAGYGSGQAIDIVVNPDVSDNSNPQSLYWRIKPDITIPSSPYECYRINETINVDSANAARDIHILTLSKNVANCGKDKDLTTITDSQWSTATTGNPSPSNSIIRLTAKHPTNTDGSLKAADVLSVPIFRYSVFTDCVPFGIKGIKTSKGLSIEALRLDVDSTNVGNKIARSVCLNNIP